MKLRMAVYLSLHSLNHHHLRLLYTVSHMFWSQRQLRRWLLVYTNTTSGIQIHTYRQYKVTNYLYSTYLDCENTSGYPEALVLTTVPSCFFTPKLWSRKYPCRRLLFILKVVVIKASSALDMCGWYSSASNQRLTVKTRVVLCNLLLMKVKGQGAAQVLKVVSRCCSTSDADDHWM